MNKIKNIYIDDINYLEDKNIFNGKNLFILKKEKKSFYYDTIIEGIIEFGKPKNVYIVEYNSNSSFLEINNQIDYHISNNKIEIFICASYYFILPNILKKMNDNTLKIRIDGDDISYFNCYSKWYAQFFDLNITNSIISKQKFLELGHKSIIYSSPYKEIASLNNLTDQDIDISFVGLINKNLNRSSCINYLIDNNFNINTFGLDSKSGYLSQRSIFEIFKRTKININFTGVASLSIDKNIKPIYNSTMSGRIFEIIGCGGFLLTEYDPTIEYFFEPNRDLVIFYNKEDLIIKTKYYLENEDKRKQIALNAYNKFRKYYEYKENMPAFIKNISNNSDKKTKINVFEWPSELRFFLNRFINKKYLLNLKYLYNCFKYTNKFLITKE